MKLCLSRASTTRADQVLAVRIPGRRDESFDNVGGGLDQLGMYGYTAQALWIPPYVLTRCLADRFIVFRPQPRVPDKSP